MSHRYAVHIALLILAVAIAGCGSAAPTVVKSNNGQFQITALSGMAKTRD